MNKILVIAGRTGTGKSNIAKSICKRLGTNTVINGDAIALTKGLSVLTNF